ncbi:hypothetical protein I317_03482 [Kwoniella heveanensis CBS 569]|nr:hypothetical protein I317_03482 [Kwoniella heveanensis CBS 569]
MDIRSSSPTTYSPRARAASPGSGSAPSLGPRPTSSSGSTRGRPSSPRPPPSYARSSLDRSPALNPLVLDERPRVPPPIYLRSSSPQGHSGKGSLKIHVPAWGVALVRPPRSRDLHPLESGGVELEPPCEDTVLSGALEVTMKERRKVQAISVGVQSVCRLHMGAQRVWEEDGIFERGVEVLAAEGEEGIWLEKGSQSFSFSLLLPATLATTDFHAFGRVSYILTARVEGIPASTSFTSMFKVSSPPILDHTIPHRGDFERVIARSDKLAAAASSSASSAAASGSSSGSPGPVTRRGSSSMGIGLSGLTLGESPAPIDDASAIAVGEGSPSLRGLYTRRHSSDISPRIPPLALSPPTTGAVSKSRSPSLSSHTSPKSDKSEWLKGDLFASRGLVVHANPSRSGGVTQLELRKEGFVDGLGSWKFTATAEVFSISSVILLGISLPAPSPLCTIFLIRLVLAQTYSITSPRTPNNPPHMPEATRNHVLYQVGRMHRPGEKYPAKDVDSLWRGAGAHGAGGEEGCKIRAVARMPNHDKIRPTTQDGTITPIRVTHELTLQVFYSIEGQCVRGEPVQGPGELRMMSVKMPIAVPSCVLTMNALDLPTYETAHKSPQENIDDILSSAPSKNLCMCGSTFAELGEAAMKRAQATEQEDMEACSGTGSGSAPGSCGDVGSSTVCELAKEEEARREASSMGRSESASGSGGWGGDGSGGASGSGSGAGAGAGAGGSGWGQ